MNGEQVGDYAHFAKDGAEDALYPLPVRQKGRYRLMGRIPYCYSLMPGGAIQYEISSDSKTIPFKFDMAIGSGTWRELGEFDLAPDAALRIVPSKSKGLVVADGFALVPADEGE